jgi:cell division protein FtsB
MAKQDQLVPDVEAKGPALQQVAAENEKLKKEIEALRGVVKGLESQLKLTGITDDIRDEVQSRMRMGLSQQDAIDVVRRQRAHDADLKEQAKTAPAPAV